MMEDALNAVMGAERQIQRILLDLEEEVGTRIASVDIDLRNFANCAVMICLAPTHVEEAV